MEAGLPGQSGVLAPLHVEEEYQVKQEYVKDQEDVGDRELDITLVNIRHVSK